MNTKYFFVLLFILSVTIAGQVFAADGDPDPYFMTGAGFNEQVLDNALQSDGKMIAAGRFTSIVGVPMRRLARLTATGDLDLDFNRGGSGANGIVRVVRVLPDNKILIGGDFTTYNGVSVNRIARLNANGTLDSTFNTGAGASSSVTQIVLTQSNQIVIAGGFSTFNGTQKRIVARLSYDGALDESLSFTGNFEFNELVGALAVQPDGKIIFGGRFWNNNNFELNNNIARLNINGSLDTGFAANVGQGGEARVAAIQVRPDGKIWIGGSFPTVNNVERYNFALLNSNGSLDTSINPSLNASITEFAMQSDGKLVLIGFNFTSPSGGQTKIIRVNSNGSIDTGFIANEYPHTFNTVLVSPAGKVFAGGLFEYIPTNVGGAYPAGIRAYNSDGTQDTSYKTRSGAVNFLAGRLILQNSGKIVFRASGTVGGLARAGVSRLNANGLVDENYAPNLEARAIATLPDDSVIAGGVMNVNNGRRYLRKINPDGTVDPTFAVETEIETNSPDINISDMAGRADGKFYIAGTFIKVGGIDRKGIARLNPDGSVDTTFNTNLTLGGAVVSRVIPQPDGKVWVSVSSLTSFGSFVFRLNENGISETFTQPNGGVSDIAYLNDGKAYLCGGFTTIGSDPVKYIARINSNGTLDPTFTPPNIVGGLAGNPSINSCHIQPDGKLIFGGEFSTVNGTTRRAIARLNPDGTLDSTFAPQLGISSADVIYSIIRQPDGNLLLGGKIRGVNNLEKNDIARVLMTRKKSSFDFDGDGKTDIGIFRPTTGAWWLNASSTNVTTAVGFGVADDKLIPADFTGDGKTDIALFRPSTSQWFILRSEDSSFYGFQFGANGDIPAPGDFDGDGKADVAVFRPSTASWYVLRSLDGSVTSFQFGLPEDKPVIADYDGDGKADIGIFRPTPAEWWILKSSGGIYSVQFGQAGDKAVPGDYTGDGKADVAFWRPSNGTWYILRSEDSSFYGFPFGNSSDTPSPGDYDGDGKMDAAVFRDSNASWYLLRSTAGFTGVAFGNTGDKPIPNSFVR